MMNSRQGPVGLGNFEEGGWTDAIGARGAAASPRVPPARRTMTMATDDGRAPARRSRASALLTRHGLAIARDRRPAGLALNVLCDPSAWSSLENASTHAHTFSRRLAS